jgi:hypothetical protein
MAPLETLVLQKAISSMFEFQYEVELTVTHPNINPEAITETLGISPQLQAMAGQEATNKRGERLGKPALLSYWSCRLHPEPRLNTLTQPLDAFLGVWLEKLRPHEDFLKALANENAEIQFRVGWHCDSAYSTLVLPPEFLNACSSLGIGMEISAIVPSSLLP